MRFMILNQQNLTPKEQEKSFKKRKGRSKRIVLSIRDKGKGSRVGYGKFHDKE